MCLSVFLVASFTFYLAGSDDRELTTPTGTEENVISFVYLDPSETQFSGMEPEDELGTLTVSGITPDGFDLSWNLNAHSVYDSFTVECKDTQRLGDVREVQLPGDATASRIQGLKALTKYQIKLYGITSNLRTALLEAVAVTGIKFSLHDIRFLLIRYFFGFKLILAYFRYVYTQVIIFFIYKSIMMAHWQTSLRLLRSE